MAYLLGIDIGTSAAKVALFSSDGEAIGEASEGYATAYPAPGHAEQQPDDWWDAACRGIRQVLQATGVDAGAIAGIGVDGQSWAAVAIDAAGEVLCPTPLWMDTRAEAECRALAAAVGEERLYAVSGNPLTPSYTLPKLLWYRAHRPDAFRRMRWVLQSNSFIVQRLTGAITQDLSQGYGLHCFDMRTGAWDAALLRDAGLSPEILPALYACHAAIGGVQPSAARATGLAAGTPVVAGGLDAAAGALGVGVLADGQTQEQGGQAGGFGLCMDRFQADPRLILSRHVVPDRWLLQGGTVGGGGVLRWLREVVGMADFDGMSAEAEGVPPGAEGVLFLPYMAGERSPIWNPAAKGVFYGLDYRKTRAHLIRAVMEGVAYSVLDNLSVAEAAGCAVGVLRATGGATRSPVWMQIKADVTGRPVQTVRDAAATAKGAAMLAGVGTGVFGGFDEAVRRMVREDRLYRPDGVNAAVYREGFARYRALYGRLAGMMTKAEEA